MITTAAPSCGEPGGGCLADPSAASGDQRGLTGQGLVVHRARSFHDDTGCPAHVRALRANERRVAQRAVTVSVSRPGAQHDARAWRRWPCRPRRSRRRSTSTRTMPCEPAVSRAESPGRSATSVASLGADRLGVEDARGRRWRPRASTPRSRRPNSAAGALVISCTARSSDTSWRPRRQSARKRVVYGRAAHAVEVRAGVGAADHRARVVPHLGAAAPTTRRRRPAGSATARCAARRRSRCRAACRTFDCAALARRCRATIRPLQRPRSPREYVSPMT